jgi:hypothetical protein
MSLNINRRVVEKNPHDEEMWRKLNSTIARNGASHALVCAAGQTRLAIIIQ